MNETHMRMIILMNWKFQNLGMRAEKGFKMRMKTTNSIIRTIFITITSTSTSIITTLRLTKLISSILTITIHRILLIIFNQLKIPIQCQTLPLQVKSIHKILKHFSNKKSLIIISNSRTQLNKIKNVNQKQK